MKQIKFGETLVGKMHRPYYIADLGANHEGSLDRAYKLIELAKEAGADAAKFQNFSAGKIVSRYGFENLGGKLSHQAAWKTGVFEVYEKYSIEKEWTSRLKSYCDGVGIEYFSSPYDFESVDLLDEHVSMYKIGSGDITWLDIIEYIAKKQKPVLVAAGASDMQDVRRAMQTILHHNQDVVLMQCNTNYTGDKENFKYVNLNVLNTFAKEFPDVVLGLSDHTPGHSTVLGAIALGARVIEKHFTDDNTLEGPDHKFAMNPRSWREMVDNGNELFAALGDGIKKIEANETASSVVQRRSVRVRDHLKAGHIIVRDDLEFLRPKPVGSFSPYEARELLGKELVKNLAAGEHITKNHLKA